MPPVVVLRGEARDDHGAAVEGARHGGVAEQALHREAVALDPVLGREVDGRERGEAAVGGAADDVGVGGLRDGPRLGADLAREELVEAGVAVRVRLHHLRHAGLQLEALDEGPDVALALRQVVLAAHLLALLAQQVEGALPVQGLLLLGAVVEQVHADADVDAHGLPVLLARLAVDHVVAHVEVGLEPRDGIFGQDLGQEGVGVLVVGGAVQRAAGVGGVVVEGLVGDVVEGGRGGLEAVFIEVLGGHGESEGHGQLTRWTWGMRGERSWRSWRLSLSTVRGQHGVNMDPLRCRGGAQLEQGSSYRLAGPLHMWSAITPRFDVNTMTSFDATSTPFPINITTGSGMRRCAIERLHLSNHARGPRT